jgi:PAS domain S-box-containing protein
MVAKISPALLLRRFLVLGGLNKMEQFAEQNINYQAELFSPYLRQIIDTTPNFIFAKDRNGRFCMVNKAFADIYQTTVENMIGKTDADFNPDADKVRQFLRDDMEVFSTGRELIIPEQSTITASGAQKWWQTVKRPITDQQGSITEVLTIVTDITERKEIETTLRTARDEALEASHIKTEILARTSHELQTPLGAILGYAEMVEAEIFGPVTTQQKDALQKIIQRSTELTTLIRNLIDQAQFHAKETVLTFRDVDPQAILQQMHQTLDTAAAAKGLKLTSQISLEISKTILTDPYRIQQIINNLVTNAIKFTEIGQVHVQLYKPSPTHWAIEVADTGIGIPSTAQAYIFDPFRQVDGSATRLQNGFGLGLSLVKEITHAMNGDISLTSKIGEGSTFTVTLPLVEGRTS